MTTYPFREDDPEDSQPETTRILKRLQTAAEKRICKTLWGTLDAFQDTFIGNSPSSVVLDDLKDKLIATLPFGPDEVN